jgi:hydrogenase maturation protease
MNSADKVLIQGIGNPLRSDDALGPMLIERLEVSPLVVTPAKLQVNLEWVYQLQIENAEQWTHFDAVILIDAHATQTEPVKWKELKAPQASQGSAESELPGQFASHALDPISILCLAAKCYQAIPRVYLLSISGRSFEMGTELSGDARNALAVAEQFLLSKLNGNL